MAEEREKGEKWSNKRSFPLRRRVSSFGHAKVSSCKAIGLIAADGDMNTLKLSSHVLSTHPVHSRPHNHRATGHRVGFWMGWPYGAQTHCMLVYKYLQGWNPKWAFPALITRESLFTLSSTLLITLHVFSTDMPRTYNSTTPSTMVLLLLLLLIVILLLLFFCPWIGLD